MGSRHSVQSHALTILMLLLGNSRNARGGHVPITETGVVAKLLEERLAKGANVWTT